MSRTGSAPPADFLERERLRVEHVFAELVDGAVPTTGSAVQRAMAYALSTTGKRLRPILCVAAYRASRPREADTPDALYRLACSLEIVHTYSLVHDDLPCMDDDDLRRGRPTVHRVFDPSVATLAGAALLPLAIRVLEEHATALTLPDRVRAALVDTLCGALGAGGMVAGQLLDLEAEGAPIDHPRLEAIHRAKTGALLTAALRMGALAAGASPEQLAALTSYGDSFGLAFQITDDILDVTGSAGSLGKTPGRDEQLAKASYPRLFGVDGARVLAREHADRARAAVADLHAPELVALANYVVHRHR